MRHLILCLALFISTVSFSQTTDKKPVIKKDTITTAAIKDTSNFQKNKISESIEDSLINLAIKETMIMIRNKRYIE